jgi:conjugal transfer pilus assembly protein TraI
MSFVMPNACNKSGPHALPLLSESLPLIALDLLISRHAARLDRLIDAIGTRNPALDQAIRMTVKQVAQWMHLLPASESNHHAYPGGLIEHSLDVALGAALSARSRLGDLALPGWERRRREDAFTLAAALAGLCHDLGKPASDLIVSHPKAPTSWNPYRESLIAWGERHALEEYHLTWLRGRGDRHRGFALLLLRQSIDPLLLDEIRTVGPALEASLINTLSKPDPEEDGLSRCVLKADTESATRSLKDPRRQILGMGAFGPEAILIHAIRHLVRSGQWEANLPGSPLWIMEQQVHLIWPGAIHDIQHVLTTDRLAFLPFEPDLLAAFMNDRGLIALPDPEGPPDVLCFRIHPEGLRAPIRVLRLKSPRLIFDGEVPASIQGVVLWPTSREAVADAPLDAIADVPSSAMDPLPVNDPSPATTSKETEDPSVMLMNRLRQASDQLDWQLREQRLFLPHPSTAKVLGHEPLPFIAILEEMGWLETTPRGALRKVCVLDGRRGILLTPDRSASLLPGMKVPLRKSKRTTVS